jgi:FkbM family methyltransferase
MNTRTFSLKLFVMKIISRSVECLISIINRFLSNFSKKIILVHNCRNSEEIIENNDYILLNKSKIDFEKKETIKFGKSILLLNHWVVDKERIDNQEYILLDKSKISSSEKGRVQFNKNMLLTESSELDNNIIEFSDKLLINRAKVVFLSWALFHDKNRLIKVLEDNENKVFIVNGSVVNLTDMTSLFLSTLEYKKLIKNDCTEYDFFDNIRRTENKSFEVLERMFYRDDTISLSDSKLKLHDSNSLMILFNELLITEDYFFESESDEPLIIDCGSNFGLSLFYYKRIYPNSKIISFEPLSSMREILRENIQENNWKNIQLEPYALWRDDTEMMFQVPIDDSMAGSLTDRRSSLDSIMTEEKVLCRKLSTYLTNKIDFLKLDIEVLEESKELLGNVNYIFCEYHHLIDDPRLGRIITIFENAGFDINVTKSYSYARGTKYRPMKYLNDKNYLYSASIYCKNKEINK